MYTARVITDTEGLGAIQQEWDRLIQADDRYGLFNTFEWAWSWINAYWQPDYRLHVIVISSADDVAAIIPFYRQTKSNRCLFLGTGERESEEVSSEYLDFLVAAAAADKAALHRCIRVCIRTSIEQPDACRLVLLNCLETSHAFTILRGHAKAIFTPSGREYVLQIKASLELTLANLASKQSKRARYLVNSFSKNAELAYVPFTESDFTANWSQLKLVHQAHWESKGMSGAINSDVFSGFHRFMHEHYPAIRQVFSLLKKGETVLSINHYYYYRNRYYFYLTGTNKVEESRLSPGMLLHLLCIRQLGGSNASYDFLKGGSTGSYKQKFCEPGAHFYTIMVFEAGFWGTLRYLKIKLRQVLGALFARLSGQPQSGRHASLNTVL